MENLDMKTPKNCQNTPFKPKKAYILTFFKPIKKSHFWVPSKTHKGNFRSHIKPKLIRQVSHVCFNSA